MSDYINERNNKYSVKIDKLLKENLPSFCKQFIIGIAMNTTVLTRYNYANDLKLFFDFTTKFGAIFEGKNIKEITLADLDTIEATDIEEYLVYIDNYINNKNNVVHNSDRAKARKFCSVRALFRYFYKKDKLAQNITLKVDMPKIHDKEIIRLEENEVIQVLDGLEKGQNFISDQMNAYNDNNLHQRDYAIFMLLLGTGIRISECVGLDIADIDFTNLTFKIIRKGGKEAILYLNQDIANSLTIYINNDRAKQISKKVNSNDKNALFLSLQGNRISVRAVEILVKKHTQCVSQLKNITPHKLRATYGTALYRATNDIYVVAEVLGHKDINTTKKHYAALSEDIKKSAVSKVNYRKNKE
ncbi:MAG: tyrosine-type recombinase/integrase [Clostridia bacterium]